MKIFLDANIVFSASNPHSPLHAFLLRVSDQATLVCSAYTIDEAARNIVQKRPHWQPGLAQIMKHVRLAPEHVLTERVDLHEKDCPVLGAAVAARCDFLLTGDKRDFGHLYGKTIGGVKIISYRMLTQLL